MNSSFYEMSSVVLGLRSEYQRMESKLQELRKYARLDSRYDNLHFSLNKRNINYDFISKNKSPNRIVSSTLFGSNVEKENGVFISDKVLEIINSDKFNKVASDILDDEFCSNIELSTMRTDLAFRNQVVKINIHSGSIHICLENILKMKKPVVLSYYADKDEINLKKEKGILREYDVNRLLGVLVTKGAFPSYHRNLIDSSCDKNVDVVMNQSLSTSCNFDIIEESDKFVLQKKKKIIKILYNIVRDYYLVSYFLLHLLMI